MNAESLLSARLLLGTGVVRAPVLFATGGALVGALVVTSASMRLADASWRRSEGVRGTAVAARPSSARNVRLLAAFALPAAAATTAFRHAGPLCPESPMVLAVAAWACAFAGVVVGGRGPRPTPPTEAAELLDAGTPRRPKAQPVRTLLGFIAIIIGGALLFAAPNLVTTLQPTRSARLRAQIAFGIDAAEALGEIAFRIARAGDDAGAAALYDVCADKQRWRISWPARRAIVLTAVGDCATAAESLADADRARASATGIDHAGHTPSSADVDVLTSARLAVANCVPQ